MSVIYDLENSSFNSLIRVYFLFSVSFFYVSIQHSKLMFTVLFFPPAWRVEHYFEISSAVCCIV